MNESIEEIKKFILQNNTPVFGISAAESLQNEPRRYRPSDMLPQARSILCLGMPIPKGIFRCKERSEWMYWRAANIYYRTIDAALMQVCSILEAKKEVAVPIYGCFPYDMKGKGRFLGLFILSKDGGSNGNWEDWKEWVTL